MNDLFTRLSHQAQGVVEPVRPLTAPLFAPLPPQPESGMDVPDPVVGAERTEPRHERKTEVRDERKLVELAPQPAPAERREIQPPPPLPVPHAAPPEPLPTQRLPLEKAAAPVVEPQPPPVHEREVSEPLRRVRESPPQRVEPLPVKPAASVRKVLDPVPKAAVSSEREVSRPEEQPRGERVVQRTIVTPQVQLRDDHRAFEAQPATPITRISIGTIEVRAILKRPAPAPATRQTGPAMPLSEYLQKRSRGGR